MIAVFGVLIGDLMKDVIDEKANKLATSLPHGVSSSCRDLQRRDPGFVFNGFSGEYAFHFSTGIGTEPHVLLNCALSLVQHCFRHSELPIGLNLPTGMAMRWMMALGRSEERRVGEDCRS